jgi:hypothetical protein
MDFSFLDLILPSFINFWWVFGIFHHSLLFHVVLHCHKHAPKPRWNVPLTKCPFFKPKNYQGRPWGPKDTSNTTFNSVLNQIISFFGINYN